MKVIIAGGRDFNDYNLMIDKLDDIFANLKPIDVEIVCGEANGADKLGKRYGREHDCKIKSFPANWNEYGKSAGYIRNEEMAKYADAAVIFWNKSSKGTKHMIDLAKKYNLKLRIIYY